MHIWAGVRMKILPTMGGGYGYGEAIPYPPTHFTIPCFLIWWSFTPSWVYCQMSTLHSMESSFLALANVTQLISGFLQNDGYCHFLVDSVCPTGNSNKYFLTNYSLINRNSFTITWMDKILLLVLLGAISCFGEAIQFQLGWSWCCCEWVLTFP